VLLLHDERRHVECVERCDVEGGKIRLRTAAGSILQNWKPPLPQKKSM
jgi:hypothetical protein